MGLAFQSFCKFREKATAVLVIAKYVTLEPKINIFPSLHVLLNLIGLESILGCPECPLILTEIQGLFDYLTGRQICTLGENIFCDSLGYDEEYRVGITLKQCFQSFRRTGQCDRREGRRQRLERVYILAINWKW